MKETIQFQSGGVTLEGIINPCPGDTGVVITHPHPLYGGDMRNYVVEAIEGVFRNKHYTTLRFNFRGVGRSGGSFDNGSGEQKDVLAAVSYLQNKGMNRIMLAGYSFGTWVNALAACSGASAAAMIQAMVMVSPPVAFMDFESISSLPCLKLVVSGSDDDFAPVDLVKKFMPVWNDTAEFKVIQDADHFYSGAVDALESVLEEELFSG